MIIGRMNRRVELVHQVAASDGQGGRTTTRVTVTTVWAEFRKPTLSVVEQNGALASEVTREISVRYRTDVRRGWRVICDGRTYDVLHTYDINREATIMVCREVIK